MRIYKALRKPTILHFDNQGKYGTDFKEVQIVYQRGMFRVYLTDGYKYLNAGTCFNGLKDAINYGKEELKQ